MRTSDRETCVSAEAKYKFGEVVLMACATMPGRSWGGVEWPCGASSAAPASPNHEVDQS